MGRFKRALGPLMLAAAAATLWSVSATTVPAESLPPIPPVQEQVGYVGQEMCLECHDDMADSYAENRHSLAMDPRTPSALNGCESCHGPGEAHVEEADPELIRRFPTLPVDEASAVCATCHNRGDHAFWAGSQHDGRDVGCTTCHSVHDAKSDHGQLAAATISATCESCHADKAAKMQRVGHMPVREGKMECTSCHNPHGSANVQLLDTGFSVNESCSSCHAEKRGPFLWEHAAVQESCTTCHDPHGSNNDRLLVTKVPQLCQRCHVHSRHPSRPYTDANLPTASQGLYRSCVNCHQTLHGSNHPAGKTFLR